MSQPQRTAFVIGKPEGEDVVIPAPRTQQERVSYLVHHAGFHDVRAAQVYERFLRYERVALKLTSARREERAALIEEREALRVSIRNLLQAMPAVVR